MKRIDENQIQDNKLDETIRAAFGFTDEQIQAELDDADANPDTSPELRPPDDEFQQILRKIQERGIQPIPLGTERKTSAAPHSGRKIFTFRRMRRAFIAAAVLGVVCVGVSMNSVGKSATKYRVINDGGTGNNIAWSNVKKEEEITDEQKSYYKIEQRLKIPALKVGYVLPDMKFVKLIINDYSGILRFEHKGQYIHLYELGSEARKNGMYGSDRRIKVAQIYNPWLNKDIDIYQEDLGDDKWEYSADIKDDYDEINYYISGITEESEFVKIVEGLYIDSMNN